MITATNLGCAIQLLRPGRFDRQVVPLPDIRGREQILKSMLKVPLEKNVQLLDCAGHAWFSGADLIIWSTKRRYLQPEATSAMLG